MSGPGEQKKQFLYRDPDENSSSGRDRDPTGIVQGMLAAGENGEVSIQDEAVLQRLRNVAAEFGEMDFCSSPVCESLVAAVLFSGDEPRRSVVSKEICRVVAETLSQDVTASMRLTALWNKLRRGAA